MSLNQLINPVERIDIKCNKLDCNELTGDTTLIDNLEFKTQNGDVVNLSSLASKGTSGYRLTSDGDGSVSWVEGAGVSNGVEYNGNVPVSLGKIAIYGGTDGNLIKDSTLSDTDILNKNGDSMSGTLDMTSNDIENVNNVNTSSIDGITLIAGTNTGDLFINNEAGNNVKITNCNLDLDNNNIQNVSNATIGNVNCLSMTSTDVKQNEINFNSNIDMKENNIVNINRIDVDEIGTGLTEIKITDNLDINNNNINNVNNIQNVNNLYVDNVYGALGTININNEVDLSTNIIKGNQAQFNNLYSYDQAQDILINNNIDLGGTSEIKGATNITTTDINTDTITSNAPNTEINLGANTNLNLNGNSIIGLDLINGIQPSGGLYSESSGFSTASTTEVDILGQGASSGTLSIPANSFTALSMYSFKASGVLSGGSNDLFTLRAKTISPGPISVILGEIMPTLQDNNLVNVAWDIMIDFTIRAIGASGTAALVLSGAFRYTNNNDLVRTFLRTEVLTTGFDTTRDNTLELTFQNDATNPLTNFQIEQASFTKWY